MEITSQQAVDLDIGELMARFGTDVYRTCFVYLSDAHLAEDAMQETFLKAYKARKSFRGQASPSTWLMRIAINVCKDMRRGSWFRHVDRKISLDDLPETEAPETEAPEFSADDTLIREVMALPPKDKEVILLTYYWGMSAREVASTLNIAIPTFYLRLKKAQQKLKTQLEGWYHDE